MCFWRRSDVRGLKMSPHLFTSLILLSMIGCTHSDPREKALRDDLFMLRLEIRQYTSDHHEHPATLNDIVEAG